MQGIYKTIFLGLCVWNFPNFATGQEIRQTEPSGNLKDDSIDENQTHMKLFPDLATEGLESLLPHAGALILRLEGNNILLAKTKFALTLQIAAFEAFLGDDLVEASLLARGKLQKVPASERLLYAFLPEGPGAELSIQIKAYGLCSSDPVECGADQMIWSGRPETININSSNKNPFSNHQNR